MYARGRDEKSKAEKKAVKYAKVSCVTWFKERGQNEQV